MFLDFDFLDEIKNNKYSIFYNKSKDNISLSKGYQIIEHTYDLLKHKTQLYCEDIITNLRKAINYRVRDLVKNLGFNHIANPNLKKEQKLEQLEDIGIVKSLLIKKLLNIRNNIEYEGATPPNPSDCEELIDIVWYFYKTTDIYCKFKFGGLEFRYIIDEVMYAFIFDFDFDKHEYINFRGCVPDKFLSKTNTDNKKIPIDSLNERKSAKKNGTFP